MPLLHEFPLTRLLNGCETDENGCLLWNGVLGINGYGVITIDKKPWRAHRLAYYLANGEIPEGKIIGHKCDVRRCCNPEHLEAITHDENMAQMKARGRAKKVGKPMTPIATRILIANSDKSIAALCKEYSLDNRTVERYRLRYRYTETT
jgi:hypothetical protein